MSIPWVEKYRPRSLKDVVDQEEAKAKLEEVVGRWLKGEQLRKGVLLAGPPGVGKTTLIHALANDYGLEVLELNASDERTGDRISRIVGRSIRESSLFGFRGKLILFDEVDGLDLKEDRGGVGEIIKVIGESRFPVVLTANDPWDPKLRDLRERCEVIQLKPLKESDVVKLLRKICDAEKIRCSDDALRLLAKASMGDARAAINDLELVARGRSAVTEEDAEAISYRAHQVDMFRVVDMAIKARNFEEARRVTSLPSFDWESFFTWITESVPVAYGSAPMALFDAMNNLSRADLIRGRIERLQEWELMRYMLELMTAGAALVREKPKLPFFIKYGYPAKIRLLNKIRAMRQVREVLIRKLREEAHLGSRVINLEVLPMLRLLIRGERGSSVLAELSRVTGLGEEEIRLALSTD
ncbi:replication protein C [Thermocladium modestius]|uniref:Replication factor C large subunit n=1 Tax=Thermocladium modestius TaxID=62609 RepID=A0A830GVK9_9CREN|nr:replication factor C large subunit [Thermocladium modestius]GGP21039.1 replication protein C [Thermocladium modestius]